MKDIQSIKIEVKEGIYAHRVFYMKIRGEESIFLTHNNENLTLREIKHKAVELICFLRVLIEVF